MKLNIFHFAVASLFNFSISSGIIAILVFTVLSNIDHTQSQVEVSMMETDVANIRWELRELWAHRNATGQSIAGSEIDEANPLRLVNERPKNYSGEYAETPPGAESVWYFDTKARRLVYVFSDGHQARYRLTGTAKLNRASLGAMGGIDLVLE
ncbi:hypothetical protein [Methylobacter tundripaludum]|uniref:hypothetical protein n=1 Tax=Methylobacter tundripaludum TaxID=173365 RepID=UPI000484BDD6|nr:hypothetical protein [Methylobacter tundripaludum]